ncbi:MAG: cytochrome c [Novosphingobium sp.]
MRTLTIGAVLVLALAAGGAAYAGSSHAPSAVGHGSNAGLMQMGMGQMGMGPGQRGFGPIPRHRAAMMQGVPEPYRSMTNPLPGTPETLKRGAKVYTANCMACHGAQGQGDGPAAASLTPPPGNLAWLANRPMGQWGPFIYWSVAEGGAQFGSAMPAYRDNLTPDEIWAVTAYIQAHFPPEPK